MKRRSGSFAEGPRRADERLLATPEETVAAPKETVATPEQLLAAPEEPVQQQYRRYVIATTFYERCRGLLGRSALWLGRGVELVIIRCASIHTCGMRRAIDVAFAGADGTVLKVACSVSPWRVERCAGACFAVERFSPAGEDASPWYRVGDTLPLVRYGAAP